MIPLIGMHFMGRGAETIVLYCCVGIRERERKLVVNSVYHSKIMDTHESNQAAFQLAVLFLLLCWDLSRTPITGSHGIYSFLICMVREWTMDFILSIAVCCYSFANTYTSACYDSRI